MPDYEIHLGSGDLHSLLGDETDLTSGGHHGFYEDPDEIQRVIDEELGAPRRRRRPKNRG